MAESIELYEFQSECVDKLGVPGLASRLIGDGMGLGKTVEALAIDMKLRSATKSPFGSRRPTLIIAPHAVHPSWVDHIGRMCIGARVMVIDRKNRAPFIKAALSHRYDYLICHYEALRLIPELREVNLFHIVCDEVHRIKNRKAQQTRAVKALDTDFKSGLSGTPADNKPQDLWSVINWLYPKKYSSYWRFVNNYCEQDLAHGKGSSFRKIVGVKKDRVPYLLAEMRPWYVRRLKKDVLKDLPDKWYTDIKVDLLPSQRKAYNQMRKEMIAWVGEHEDQPLVAPVVIAQLTRLQQFALASPEFERVYTQLQPAHGKYEAQRGLKPKVILREPSSKLDALESVIGDNEDEQHVIFSQSRSMIDLVEARLTKAGLRVGKYTGGVRQRIRDQNVEDFQAGKLDIFAGTIAAGGEGITLTASSTVHFLDRHWNPTKNEQAEDRLHRIGQKDAVQVIDYTARDTVDLGRRQQIAAKWETLRILLGDTVDTKQYINLVENEGLVREAVSDAITLMRGQDG
jgi:SNF2 family DNA or RNA helicase